MAVPQRGRVPEFGKWDGSEVAYTKVFEVARKDKGAAPMIINPNDPRNINPNDPEQNPEAFKPSRAAPAAPKPSNARPGHMDQQRRGHKKTTSVGSTSSEHSQPEPQKRRETSKRPSKIGVEHQRGPSVPKFGAWNDSDAKSNEGYTLIFNEVKEKKQHTPPNKLPTPSPPPRTYQPRESKEDNDSIWGKISSCFKPSVKD